MYVVVLCEWIVFKFICVCVCVWSGGKENLLHLYDGSLSVTKVSVKTSPVHLLSLLFAPNQVKLFHNDSWLPNWTDLHPSRLTNFVLNLRYSDPLLISRRHINTFFMAHSCAADGAACITRALVSTNPKSSRLWAWTILTALLSSHSCCPIKLH